jgi:hypothetical protein
LTTDAGIRNESAKSVCAARSALPIDVPVSAKLRLGWDGVEAVDTNADMAVEGGVGESGLAHGIAVQLGIVRGAPVATAGSVIDWPAHLAQLVAWTEDITGHEPERTLPRLKQSLKMAATYGSFRRFEAVKRARSVAELLAILRMAA